MDTPKVERRRWVRFFLGSTITRYQHELDCARETIAELQKKSIFLEEAQKHVNHLEREKANQPTQWELVAWMALASAGDSAKSLSGDLHGQHIDMRWIGGYPGPYQAVPSKFWRDAILGEPKDSND